MTGWRALAAALLVIWLLDWLFGGWGGGFVHVLLVIALVVLVVEWLLGRRIPPIE